jgi:hypothetical protein
MSTVWLYVAAILPTILVATLFYFLIKSMLEGDRRERLAQSRFEREQDLRRRSATGEPPPSAGREESPGDSPTDS